MTTPMRMMPTRTLPMKVKHLIVGTPQGMAGDLYKEARYAFNYTTPESSREISLSMPLRAESYASCPRSTLMAAVSRQPISLSRTIS